VVLTPKLVWVLAFWWSLSHIYNFSKHMSGLLEHSQGLRIMD